MLRKKKGRVCSPHGPVEVLEKLQKALKASPTAEGEQPGGPEGAKSAGLEEARATVRGAARAVAVSARQSSTAKARAGAVIYI